MMPRRNKQVHRPPVSPARADGARRRGFSLLEMLVAAVVLAVGLVIVTESISSGVSAAARTERRFFAGQLAADRLNRAASGEYAALPQEGETRAAGVRYRWEVEQAPWQGRIGLLRCTVRWESRGREQTATLSRFVSPARRGTGR